MSFLHKITNVKNEIVKTVRESILYNYPRSFNVWLTSEAPTEFGYLYEDAFRKEFGDLIDKDVSSKLFLSGKHTVYAMESFIRFHNRRYVIRELLVFVEHFILQQIDNVQSDYDTMNWGSHEEDDKASEE
jgi:hypothetical protein